MSKKKEKRAKNLGSLIKSLASRKASFITAIVLLAISVASTVLTPTAIKVLTNYIYEGAKALSSGAKITDAQVTYYWTSIISTVIILSLMIIAAFICGMIAAFILNTAIQRYTQDLRKQIAHKINLVPLNYYDTRQIGDILSVVSNDVDTLATQLQNSIEPIFSSIFMVVGSLVAMFMAKWQLALVVLCSVPLTYIVLAVASKLALPLFDENQKALGVVNTRTEEDYSGQLIIKSFNSFKDRKNDFIKQNALLGKMLFKSQAVGGTLQPLMSFVSYIVHGAVLVVSGIMVAKGQASYGDITAFIVYVSIFQQPMTQLGTASNCLQLASAAASRVFEFLREEELEDESDKEDILDHNNIKGAVEFKDVCFGYVPERMLVKNFSAKIEPGYKVAVVGPTGAGKTTLVNLLMRFYEINSGDITIDGVSIKDMSRRELHEIMGMILQETWTIDGTFRENVVYNIENVDEDNLHKILEQTNLSHYVDTLPNGLETEIKAESALSAGQKQLTTIARAMVKNAPMMILDEATSNVDTRTEILISNAMDALTKGRTSFSIAHRLSTIKNADLILVMRDGNIVETGNHDSLMELGGLYSELYNAQFAKA